MNNLKTYLNQTWKWAKQIPMLTLAVLTALWTLLYSFSLVGIGIYTLVKIVPKEHGYSVNALTLASAVAAASGLIVFVKFCVHQSTPPVKKGK